MRRRRWAVFTAMNQGSDAEARPDMPREWSLRVSDPESRSAFTDGAPHQPPRAVDGEAEDGLLFI